MTPREREIRVRLESATPGEWEDIHPNADEGDIRVQVYHAEKRTVVHDSDAIAWRLTADNARFFANSKRDISYLLSQLTTAREIIDVVKGSMEFSQMMIEHALALDYLGEGSTNGMAKEAVAKLEAALAKITEMERDK